MLFPTFAPLPLGAFALSSVLRTDGDILLKVLIDVEKGFGGFQKIGSPAHPTSFLCALCGYKLFFRPP